MLRILHTSDWHLGRMLYGRQRYQEFEAFLNWLLATIAEQAIDVLLIAGDIFDTTTPSHRAQTLYYRFLSQVAASSCQHVVIIAGNHDSPSFLNAPQALLRSLNVYVVGEMGENPDDEVLVLAKDGQPRLIVAAVPYLRDKDLREAQAGETIADKNAKLVQGLSKHYAQVCTKAVELRHQLTRQGSPDIPIIAMGHLFTSGAKTVDGDGVRDLYVGNLVHIGREVFPEVIDYLALGHLHISQTVGGLAHLRYCGSPIPMGFGEAAQTKTVVMIEFEGLKPIIKDIIVPTFQKLRRVRGDYEHIAAECSALKQSGESVWLEIEYSGANIMADLPARIDALLDGSAVVVLRIKNLRKPTRTIQNAQPQESLDDLDVYAVFDKRLDAEETEVENRETLIEAYREVVRSLAEDDKSFEQSN